MGVTEKINQICRRFISSSTEQKQKLNLISWSSLCQPKLCGELRLKNLTLMNEALLMKIGWSIVVSPQSLWVQVCETKYGLNTKNLPTTLNNTTGSYLWKAIGNIWKPVLDGIRWAIGNGKQVRFWKHCWAADNILLEKQSIQPVPIELESKYVAELITPDGTWDWHYFEHLLPNNGLLQIALKPPSVNDGDDQIFWAHSNSDIFTAKSAYWFLKNHSPNYEDAARNSVWKWKGPHLIRVFLSTIMH